jgi:hypothetical protein
VNLCARIAASADPGQIRLSRELFQEFGVAHRLLCRAIGPVELKGAGRSIELLGLEWRDRSRYPSAVRVRETGQLITLPARDIISFGRLEVVEGMVANDVVLALPDASATRQISRWHFELRRRAAGFALRAVSSQPTDVDGLPLAHGDEVPVRPGTVVQLANVMTLEFVSTAHDDDGSGDATQYIRPHPPGA